MGDLETPIAFSACYSARFYGAALGRFTSPDDPLVDQFEDSPQSWNLYSYGRNNPLKNIDPTGQNCVQAGNGSYNDDSNISGPDCATYLAQQPNVVNAQVSGKPGSVLAAIAVNAALSISNAASDFFSFIAPNSQLLSSVPVGSGPAAQIGNGIGIAATLLTPGGEEANTVKEIKITWKGLLHVLGRHTGDVAGKSFFGDSAAVSGLVKAAEKIAPTPQAGGNFVRIIDAGRTIGTDVTTGQATSTYTVITDAGGNLVTAFPGKPLR